MFEKERNNFNKNKKYKYYIIIIFIFLLSIFFSDIKLNKFNNFKEKNILINYKIFNFIKYIKKRYFYNNLNYINNKLKNKIFLLKKENIENKIKLNIYNSYKKENIYLKKILNIKLNRKYIFLISKIIYKNYNKTKLIIDKGSNDKLYLGMPVINEYGIIGQITKIQKDISIVTTILDYRNPIPAKIERNNLNIILNKYPKNYKLYIKKKFLFNLSNKDIEKNDLAVTNRLNNKYPEGYPIANVHKINDKNNILNIIFNPTVDFDKLNYAVILK